MRNVGTRIAALVAIALLVAATAALAAGNGRYRGKTSQGKQVSFRVTGTGVSGFTIRILDRCPDGHTLAVREHYPQMTIANRHFGGKFVPVGGHKGEKATLKATVGARRIKGTLKDASYSKREAALCHGSIRFTAKRS